MKHLPLRECGYAIGGLLLLLALYIGAYFGCVSRELGYLEITPSVEITIVVPTYPFKEHLGPDRLRSLFSPIHELDRRFRVDYWNDLGSVVPRASPPGYCR